MRRVFLLLVLIPALACRPKPPPPVVAVYGGALMSASVLVARLAENAAPLRTLWARHDFAVTVLDRNDKPRSFDGDGVLLLRKPPAGSAAGTPVEVRLQGSKDVMGQVFDLGANRERAWLTLLADIDTMYWLPQGAEVAATKPGEATIPARPDLVADVLGIADWGTDLTQFPTPVLRYDSAADAYVLTFIQSAPDGLSLVTRREVHVDRASLKVVRVLLFSLDGRVAVRSELGRHAALSPKNPVLVPTDIVMSFPQSKATIRLTLRNMQASRNNLPGDVSFRFPSPPPVANVVRLGEVGGK